MPRVLQLTSLSLLPQSQHSLLIDHGDPQACLAGESLTLGTQATLNGGVLTNLGRPAKPCMSLSAGLYQAPNPPEVFSPIPKCSSAQPTYADPRPSVDSPHRPEHLVSSLYRPAFLPALLAGYLGCESQLPRVCHQVSCLSCSAGRHWWSGQGVKWLPGCWAPRCAPEGLVVDIKTSSLGENL